MSGEVVLGRRTIPDRLRFCVEQLAATTPRRDDALVLAAVRQILDNTAAELDRVMARPALSEREMDVLRCLDRGLSRSRIAEALGLTRTTVHARLRRIFEQLGVSSALAAVAAAHRLGLLDPVGAS